MPRPGLRQRQRRRDPHQEAQRPPNGQPPDRDRLGDDEEAAEAGQRDDRGVPVGDGAQATLQVRVPAEQRQRGRGRGGQVTGQAHH